MRKLKLTTRILIALVIGTVIGLLLGNNEEVAMWFQPLGDIFIRLITLIMLPLVFSSLLLGVSNLSDIKKVGKIGIVSVVYFMASTLVAGIDRILDMGRTMVNITGDSAAAVIISNIINKRREGKVANQAAYTESVENN